MPGSTPPPVESKPAKPPPTPPPRGRNFRIFSIAPLGGIAVEGCLLQRVALHRHLDIQRTSHLHKHKHHQILFYLRGSGRVRTGGEVREISTGTGILIPAGCEHRFIRQSRRSPLCLVIDFSSPESFALSFQQPGIFRLSLLRKLVNELTHFKNSSTLPDRLQRDGIAAQLLGLCLGMVLESEAAAKHPINLLLQMENLIEQAGSASISLTDAARQSGYQKDYLNRILKEQSGMTFGQLRSQLRLRRARNALRKLGSVNAAAETTGFEDVNYFIRWFRKQTGQTPGALLRETATGGRRE